MIYKQFAKFIADYKAIFDKWSKARELGIDLLEYDDLFHKVIDQLGLAYFSEGGWDWISWYVCETDFQSGKEKYEARDTDGNLICQDVEGLYEYLVKEKYISVTEEK